jgi:beta-mannosidase
MARRFFQPVNVVAIPDAGSLRLFAVNDTAAPVEVEAEAFAVSLDGASTRPLATGGALVGTDAAQPLAELGTDRVRDGEILAWRWKASNGMAGGDVFAPVRWKHLDLRPARIRVTTEPTGDSLRVTLAAEAVALFVTLEADRPGRFSTNAISLFPGHDAAITFTPSAGDPADTTLTVRDLHSSFATA